jgi:hypothetical protein
MGHLCGPVLVTANAHIRKNDYVSGGEEGQNER